MKYNIDNRLKDTAIVNLTDFLNVIDGALIAKDLL